MNSALAFIVLLIFPHLSEQHARLMEPPSRASMWRVGFPTPRDIDDNQSYCGGYGVQFGSNGGKCGICGDPWHELPRAHEAPNGIYATGIIAKAYKQGSFIPVIVDITANHQGYFIFKLCANNDIFSDPDQSCFDQTPLWVGGGLKEYNHTRFPINDYETGLRMVYVRLPLEVTCEQCILQWTYVAGNNWGTCEDGTSGMGCGPQEHFRSCSDIQIVRHPLLSTLLENNDESNDLYEQSLQENELDEDDDVEKALSFGNSQQKLASIRRKEALLRKKKQLLREVIKKLRDLISQSQILEESRDDQMASAQRTVSQFLPPSREGGGSGTNLAQASENGQKVRPWWDRIMSNRH